jgi:hypothetical protein
MPSKSAKQAHFMAAVAHGWQPPGRHVNAKVAKEFHAADKKSGEFSAKALDPTRHTPSGKPGNQSTDAANSY